MGLSKEIIALMKKEFLLEWRGKTAINSILLYVVAAVFILFVSFHKVDAKVWNALFWIIIVFSSINAVAKSFIGESEGKNLYYYQLVSPQGFYLSKLIYNALLLVGLTLLTFIVFVVLLDNPVKQSSLFASVMLLGSLGFSSLLTMVSAIVSKAGRKMSLMSILSFPIIIPILLLVMQLSIKALAPIPLANTMKDLLILGCVNVAIMGAGYLLFPYLWRD